MAPRPIPPIERFQKFVTPEPNSGCLLWTGSVSGGAVKYGLFYIGRVNGRPFRTCAHRFSYEHYVCPITSGQQIDHRCFTTLCVNRDHLEAVTARQNLARSDVW